jgi:hypothetical protein
MTRDESPVPRIPYRQLDMVPIPEDIPELGIEAGYLGIMAAKPFG